MRLADWRASRPSGSRIACFVNWVASRARNSNPLLIRVIATTCCIGVIWVTVWLLLAQERRNAEATAVETTASLAHALRESTDRVIAGLDEVLLSARASFAESEADFDVVRWAAKRVHVDTFAYFIGRIDEHGISRESSLGPAAAGINLADRDQFRLQLDPTRDDLFVSKPVIGRASRSVAIQFSRKLLHADGRFAGVLHISINGSELSRFYGEIVGDKGYAMLVGADGVIRARGPFTDGVVGRSVDQPLLKAIESQPVGSLTTTTTQSSGTQIVSFRRVTDYPLAVVVAFDENAIYGSYWESRRDLLLMGVLSTAFVLSFGVVWGLGSFKKDRKRSIGNR